MNAVADGPELTAANGCWTSLKVKAAFQRVAPGPDGPLFARRETTEYCDEIYLGGFDDSCQPPEPANLPSSCPADCRSPRRSPETRSPSYTPWYPTGTPPDPPTPPLKPHQYRRAGYSTPIARR
jgi:hypothetical protein